MALSFTPLTTHAGAIVEGSKFDPNLSNADVNHLLDAVHQYGVVFFRDNPLTEEQHLAATLLLGGGDIYPLARLRGRTEPNVSVIEDTEQSPPDADNWHTDVTWYHTPPRYAVLQSVIIPPFGGDTMWASTAAIYESLSPTMKTLCDSLTAHHGGTERLIEVNTRIFGEEVGKAIRENFGCGAFHKLVKRHPVSGRKAIFLSPQNMTSIVDMKEDESRVLLDFLIAKLDNPNFSVRWKWKPGDIAIWDETTTAHRALSDHYPQHRKMMRSTVEGFAPHEFD